MLNLIPYKCVLMLIDGGNSLRGVSILTSFLCFRVMMSFLKSLCPGISHAQGQRLASMNVDLHTEEQQLWSSQKLWGGGAPPVSALLTLTDQHSPVSALNKCTHRAEMPVLRHT